MPKQLDCSVIIATRNRKATLEVTIRAVAKLNPAPFEIIIVDQSDPEKRENNYKITEEIAKEEGWSFVLEHENNPTVEKGGIILIQSDLRGLSRSRNTGLKRASCEIVLFTDD